jgi:uncharacterized protein (DUF2141 family)
MRFERYAPAVLAVLAATVPMVAAAQLPTPPTLAPGTGLIVGQVVDATTGRGVSGAVVTIAGARRVMTTIDGRFVFRNLPKGSHNLSAAKPGYLDGSFGVRRPGGANLPVTLEEGERRADVVVRLWRHGSISGAVSDEVGEPLVGVQVTTFRRQVTAGRRRYTPGAVATTDDRGVYRISRLIPGDHVVAIVSSQVTLPTAAVATLQDSLMGGGPNLARNPVAQAMIQTGTMITTLGGPDSREVGDFIQAMPRLAPTPPPGSGTRIFAYTTQYHPSATSIASAAVVAVASGQERTGVDLQVRPVPMSRVSGNVAGQSGPSGPVVVRLIAAGAEELGRFAEGAVTVTDANGAFTFAAVPAGDHTLRIVQTPRTAAPAGAMTTIQVGGGTVTTSFAGAEPPGVSSEPTLWASMPLSVGDTDLTGVNVLLRNGLRVTGRAEFDGAAEKPTPDQLSRMLVMIEPLEGLVDRSITPPGRVDARGQFSTFGVPAGKYFIRVPAGAPTGWTLKGAFLGDRDVSDVPFELESDVSDVVLSFTDRPASLTGQVQVSEQAAREGVVVIAFPADSKAWQDAGPNSRRMRRVAVSESGTYTIPSLPIGAYYVAAIREAAASDWTDPKFLEPLTASAAHVQIAEGEKAVQNLRIQEVR